MNMQTRDGGPPPPRQIVVVSDLTLAAANALWRAAHIAHAHGAALRLLHVRPDSPPPDVDRARLARLAEAVRRRFGVEMEVAAVHGDLVREAASAALTADLLVVAAREGRTWRERICGTAAERLVQASRIPVLVVKRLLARAREGALHAPAGKDLYERVLVSVGLGPEASDVIAAATRLSADRRVEVFHALRPQGRSAVTQAPGTAMEHARAALQERISRSGARSQGVVAAVGVGPAGPMIVAKGRAVGAELLVIGKRQRGLLARLFAGAVTQEVLSASRCDVLLVPTSPTDELGIAVPDRPPLG